jgi:hypothetical protein
MTYQQFRGFSLERNRVDIGSLILYAAGSLVLIAVYQNEIARLLSRLAVQYKRTPIASAFRRAWPNGPTGKVEE